MFSAPSPGRAAAYRQVDVESRVHAADPHELIRLLFDELLRCLDQARSAMLARDVATKTRAIGQALRVVDEGLRAAVDTAAGGTLAQRLLDLYDCVLARLTLANLRNDPALVDEVRALVAPVRDAWLQIRPAGASHGRAAH